MYISNKLLNMIGILNTAIYYVSKGTTLIALYTMLFFLMSNSASYTLFYIDQHSGVISDYVFNAMDHLCDIVLISFGGTLLGLVLNFWYNAFGELFKSSEKRVIIVRGVPGIGKKTYVEWRELHKEVEGTYTICNWTKIFERWSDSGIVYNYDPTRVREADNRLMRTYISALSEKVDRVYVVHTFEKMWQYNPYVDLANLHGYEVEIVELLCRGKRELRHFNRRSVHNVPMEKSLRVFTEWHNDKRSIVQEPYFESSIAENGDSVPLHLDTEEERQLFRSKLDKELEDYFEFGSRFEIEREIHRPIGKRRSSLDVISKMSGEDRWNARNKYKYV